jgi:hypothetical protein
MIKLLLKYPYLLALFLIPFGLAFFLLAKRSEKLSDLEDKLDEIRQEASFSEKEKNKEELLLKEMHAADHFYLDKHVESLVFLESEMKRLHARSMYQKDSDALLKRLEFLKGNRLVFAEVKRDQGELIQEVEEKLQHPVEMNEDDLKKLLVLIEGVSINPYSAKEGRPHLLIKEFDLSKRKALPDEEVFVVDFQLIKREVK